MITSDLEINRIIQGQTEIIRVYAGPGIIWPCSPLSGTGFLKYDEYNFNINFIGEQSADNALWDQTVVYNSTNMVLDFLGPNTGVQEYIPGYGEFQKFDATNFSTKFNNNIIVGEFDQTLTYIETNIQTSFVGYEPQTNGDWDQTVVYNSTNMVLDFLGPNTGVQEYIPGYGEFQKFDATNFSTKFNNNIIAGEFDQNILYDYTNIITEFTTLEPQTNGDWDQTVVYNSTNMVLDFLGPNTGVQEYIPGYGEFQKFDATNFSTKFNNNIIVGEFDQTLTYIETNIQTSFVGYEPQTNGDWDQTVVYNSTNMVLDFLGPNTGTPVFTPDYFSFQKFDATNFSTKFTGTTRNFTFDQNLGYGLSNIATEFIL